MLLIGPAGSAVRRYFSAVKYHHEKPLNTR